MAAKTITEALSKADIKMVINQMLNIGPMFEKDAQAEAAESLIKQNVRNQMRDLLSHQCQIFGFKNNCREEMDKFFSDIFEE